MIGGQDIVIPNPGSDPGSLLEGCTRVIRERWPALVIEDAAAGKRFEHFWDVPFRGLTEVMLYRDQAAWDSWERLGADASNRNQMVHVLASKDTVTFVVDDRREPQMASLLAELKGLVERAHPFLGLSQLRRAA